MNCYPYLTIDLSKIEHNTRAIVALCGKYGIEVIGVTKVTCGHPEVARAMLRGGVTSIADSRFENIQRLKDAGIQTTFVLLRFPPLSGVDKTVELTDISLNSELSVLEGMSKAAAQRNKLHDVIIMVDLGDLREGVMPDDLIPFMREAIKLPNINIMGLGTNLACFSGVEPNEDNMQQLVELAKTVEATFNLKLDTLSGINSSGLELIAAGRMPRQINHARIGEAILLGRETLHRRPWPGTFQDAFILHAEVLEQKLKPSAPVGIRSEDAFGKQPAFEDRGKIDRILVNVGREDIDVDGTTPLDSRLKILGASSGYLAIDATDSKGQYKVGDEISFTLNYSALLRVMTSEYVKKRAIGGKPA
ncbi:MAG: alanine/ornithine racemase family PLP-dependent enzyme [Gammaproteobacteria bacterium]|nr:alanine/ornithine racemase family PLP-dependent enzyme [Gammaproteobacteria bacterium]